MTLTKSKSVAILVVSALLAIAGWMIVEGPGLLKGTYPTQGEERTQAEATLAKASVLLDEARALLKQQEEAPTAERATEIERKTSDAQRLYDETKRLNALANESRTKYDDEYATYMWRRKLNDAIGFICFGLSAIGVVTGLIGLRRNSSSSPPIENTTARQASKPQRPMSLHCTSCGATLDEQSRFCGKCGQAT